MKVPISIYPGKDELVIYRNGTSEKIPFPFNPFFLIESDKVTTESPEEEWFNLVQQKNIKYKRIQSKNTSNLKDIYTSLKEYHKYIYYNNYSEQLFITQPDFLLKYPHTKSLKVLYFDIEVASKGDGIFPRAEGHEILSIGFSIWIYEWENNKVKKRKDKQILINSFDKNNLDKLILNSFIQHVTIEDPEIISGYNIDFFDWPFILGRCGINNIEPNFGKNNTPMSILRGNIKIPGRINFDIYNSVAGVFKDQTLFGLKNKTLKTLSTYFKAPTKEIELPTDMANLWKLYQDDPERLYRYQADDIIRTEHVGNIYLRNCIALAEMMVVPLNQIISMYSSFIPKLLFARGLWKNKEINTFTNHQKYNKLTGKIAKIGEEVEGALVGLYKDGLFPKIHKLDFASFYPSCAQTFNLGPDTTFLYSTEKYTGKYIFSSDENYNWFRIPDANFKKDLVIRVRKDRIGILKENLATFRKRRENLKKEYELAKDEDKEGIYSQQWAIKVLLNSAYGILGLQSSTYGDLMSAAMITGMCRWVCAHVCYKLKSVICEVDTDGLLLNSAIDEKEINLYIKNFIKTTFNIDDNHFVMESEELGKAFFYAMKTYIVEKDNKIVRHGSALMSSKQSKIVDRAIDLAIQHIFNNKPIEETIKEAYNFKNCSIEDFEERVKLSKNPIEYTDKTDYKLYLAEQVRLKTEQIPSKGLQINYIITKSRLPFKELKDFPKRNWNYTFTQYVTIDEINLLYYEEKITKILAKFGLRKIEQIDLFGEKPQIEKNKELSSFDRIDIICNKL